MSTKTNGTVKSSANSSVHNSISNLAVEKYSVGQEIVVGSRKVEIINYITEGGFAQIYLVKFLELLNEFNVQDNTVTLQTGDLLCLKRVMVFDENGLNEMRNEVDVMKLLIGKPNVVQYFDSNALRNPKQQGGYEVLLLMEYCPNNSLLDYMNQRLASKLSEAEILKIMYDITLGIAQLHYLDTPLIHRDIKIENVLVDSQNNFKLCDFGSTTKCPTVAYTHQEIVLLSQDIYIHTTPQYRSPEMIDLYRYLPVNEKSDIWALGIFLYKLLFYTTPFELTGQYAILHSKYDIPTNNYSPQLVNLIVIMLSENPYSRPNIYQVLFAICSILNTEIPINDKYYLGPYDFDRFINLQKKSQAIQHQLINQGKKFNDDSIKLSSSDLDILNDLYLSYFEISSKIDVNLKANINSFGSNSNALGDGLDKNSAHLDDKLSRHTTHTVDSSKSSTINNDDLNNITTTFPGTNEYTKEDYTNYNPNRLSAQTLAKNNPQRQKSVGSYASSAKSYSSSQSNNIFGENNSKNGNNNNNIQNYHASNGINSGKETQDFVNNVKNNFNGAENVNPWVKQHKSNNPFPNISKSSTPISSNIFNDQTNLQQQQQPQPQQQPQQQQPDYVSMKRLSDGSNNIIQSVAMKNQLSQSLPPQAVQVPIMNSQQHRESPSHHLPLVANTVQSQSQQQNQSSNISLASMPPMKNTVRNIFNDGTLNSTNATNNKPIQNIQGVPNTIPFQSGHTSQQMNVMDTTRANYGNNNNNNNGNSYTDNSMISSTLFKTNNTILNKQKYNSANPFPYTPSNSTIVETNNDNLDNYGNNKNMSLMTPTKINQKVESEAGNNKNKYVDNTGILIEISPLRDENATKDNNTDNKTFSQEDITSSNNSKDEFNDAKENIDVDTDKKVNKDIVDDKIENDSEEHSISEITKGKKSITRPLEISFNEMNLSQDSNLNSNSKPQSTRNLGRNNLEMEESFVSLSSSESIQLKLDRTHKRSDVMELDDKSRTNTTRKNLAAGNSSTYKPLMPIRTQSLRNEDKTKRHSLDLEYQEIDFSTGSFAHNTSSNSNINNNSTNNKHTASNLSFTGHTQDKTQPARHSRHTRTSGTASPKVRQSLDMERLRQDALLHNSSNTKKKSFFSLFKNEK